MKKSQLHALGKRKKTDIRIPFVLANRVEEMSEAMGITMNSYYALSVTYTTVLFSSLVLPGKKRAQLLIEIGNAFQKIIEEAKKAT